MTTLTETNHDGGFLCAELPDLLSRKAGTLNAGQNLLAGTIVAALLGAGAATAVGSPVGTGAVTVGALGADAMPGVYQLVCVAASSDAGTFNFYAPDGSLIRQITVGAGAAANTHIVITIADAQDYAVGDTYTITVTAGDFEALDPAEDDGAQIAAGVLFGDTDATDGDVACTVVYRDAAINSGEIVWPAAVTTAAQKNAAVAQLEARGITLRPPVVYS